MACTLFSRLFRRRREHSPISTPPVPPALPAHSDKFELERSLQELGIHADQDQHGLFLLGNLSEQGSCTLLLPGVPGGADHSSVHQLRRLLGFIRLDNSSTIDQNAGIDVLIHFLTAADAANAMAQQSTVLLEDGTSRRLQFHDGGVENDERPAKRQKTEPIEPLLTCMICCEELHGSHSKPCYNCNNRWCYDCLVKNFKTALTDPEMFPVKCCSSIVHFDVARGILSESDYQKYKQRFEEHSITKPIYCANPHCSEFLPPRIATPNERGQVYCQTCQNITCSDCRILVEPTATEIHQCTTADEITALLKQFDYKRCPRCSAGVAKMFGCSHIRCQCGAHWCWDCQRAIRICWSKPCARVREEDLAPEETNVNNDNQGEEMPTRAPNHPEQQVPQTQLDGQTPPEGETAAASATDEQMLPPQPDATVSVVSPTVEHDVEPQSQTTADQSVLDASQSPDAVPAHVLDFQEDNSPRPGEDLPAPTVYRPPACLAPPVQPEAAVNVRVGVAAQTNLDGEHADDWEDSVYDFGDEPLDESWDTWGCLHVFMPVSSSGVHPNWLPRTKEESAQPKRKICCLRCYSDITLTEPVKEQQKQTEETERKDSGVDVQEAREVTTNETTDLRAKSKRKGKAKNKRHEIPHLFNCLECGSFFCGECKKKAAKELKETRNKYLIPY